MTQIPERRTPTEWSRAKGIEVMDPDGWADQGANAWLDPISEVEFDQRAARSTVRHKVSHDEQLIEMPRPAVPLSRKVGIELTISLELEPDEAWPDGEPEHWTAADVLAEMQKLSAERLIRDWDLLTFGAEVEVQALGTSARGTLR